MVHDNSLNPLIDLYELLGDSREGYREAANRVKTPRLKKFLMEMRSDRDAMQRKLAEGIHRLWPTFSNKEDGTLKGAAPLVDGDPRCHGELGGCRAAG